jgi:flagellar biosynthesis/type III secretory pathway M-ring protein FliF/YscJ
VRVSAVIDMNSVNIATETYDPVAKVASKEEITTNSETDAGTPSASGAPAVAGSEKKDETIITEYEVGRTVKQEVVLPGEIRSLSVAAFVDLSVADANAGGAGGGSGMIMELSEVEEIIRNALGLRANASLKVVNVKFHHPDIGSMISEESSSWPRIMAIVRHASLGIMAICALLVLRIFRGARRKASEVTSAGQLPASAGRRGLLPGGAEKPESMLLRQQIASAMQSNPGQVKQLFASWLEEREG